MPKLSTPRIHEIRDILDRSLLTATGYLINNGGKDSLVDVVAKDNPKYIIRLTQTEKKLPAMMELQRVMQQTENETVLTVIQTPGYMLETEEEFVGSFKDFLTKVGLWAHRIDDEIRHPASLNEARQTFEKDLNAKIEAAVKDDTATFSQEEKEHIITMLRELSERCTALEEEKKITPQELKEINVTCNDMARAVDSLPKKAWLRAMGSKMYVFGKKALFSKPGQVAMGEAAKQLVDEAPKWLSHL